MKKRSIRGTDDYIVDIYNAKVEVAIAKWELGQYPKKRVIKKT